ILLIQEPYLDHLKASRPPVGWRPIYPTIHFLPDSPRSRSFMAINPVMSTNDWEQVECLSADVTAIRVKTAKETLLIINVYN
ncbi:hypothetical protein BDV93DRAFT_406741, partial [Ceratobasidium sp. AG-I]